VNSKEKALSESTGLGYGLTQAGAASSTQLSGELLIVPSQMAYMHIPATELRNFVDGLFPNLAVNRIADSAAGFGHRYREGHDLLLDIPATISSHGWREGFDHMGHVILTDFPTKAGIPIPGFSQSGLGQLVEQAGISSGWLQISMFDTGIGIFAFSEGGANLMQAFQGSLAMNVDTAFQTFGTGGIEIALAMSTQNPILLAGGVQNVLAGVVSTYQTISVYVDPLDFLGAAGMSALLGFGVTYGLVGESLKDSTLDAIRSGAMGSLYSVSSAFGFGALAGFVAYRLSSELAKHQNDLSNAQFSVDQHSFDLLIQEICNGNTTIKDFIDSLSLGVILPNSPVNLDIDSTDIQIKNSHILSTQPSILDTAPRKLIAEPKNLDITSIILPDDPKDLLHIYQQALS